MLSIAKSNKLLTKNMLGERLVGKLTTHKICGLSHKQQHLCSYLKRYKLKKSIYFSKIKAQLDLLNIKFFTFTDYILFPFKYNPADTPFRSTHSKLEKNTCAALLKKYYCFPKILNAAPLTKFIHVNLKFINTIIENNAYYYKIKITYIFGTPLMLNNFKVVHINMLFALSEFDVFGTFYLNSFLPGAKVLSHTLVTKVNNSKFLKIVLPKHKYGTTTTLFEVSQQLLKKFPQNKIFKHMTFQYDVENVEWHHIERVDWKISNYSQAGLSGKFIDVFHLDALLHCVLPTRFLILHAFKIPVNFSAEELLISMIYNYMILNNIYLSKDKQFIQIVQTDALRACVVKRLVTSGEKSDSAIYNSILINRLPITEFQLGDFSMLLKRINTIVTEVCNILNMYCNVEQVLCKIRTLLLDPQKIDNDYFLNAAGFLTKEELLTMKGYSESCKFMNSWFELLTATVLMHFSSTDTLCIEVNSTWILDAVSEDLGKLVENFFEIQAINVYL